MREAIKTLVEKKVLVSRTGSGTYVAESGRGIIETAISDAFEKKKHRLKDIFELRKILEPQIAFLAAERIKPDALSRLADILKKQTEAFNHGHDTRQWDELFHQTLAIASDNMVLYRVYEKIKDLFSESRETPLQSPERNKSSIQIHNDILQALINKDPKTASKKMKQHMLQIQKSLKKLDKINFNADHSSPGNTIKTNKKGLS